MDEKYIDDDGLAYDSAKILMDYGFNTLNLNKIWMELYSFDEKKLDFLRINLISRLMLSLEIMFMLKANIMIHLSCLC